MIAETIKLLIEVANTLWNARGDVRSNRQQNAEQISDACGMVADVLQERRDKFLSGTGYPPIDAPHFIHAMAAHLRGRLEDDKYSELLESAAEAVGKLESMHGKEFSDLDLEARDQLIRCLNVAIGEFRALSQALKF